MMSESKNPRRAFGINKGEVVASYYIRKIVVIYTDGLVRTVKYRRLGQVSSVVRLGRKETYAA
jgi:hypothetical protein